MIGILFFFSISFAGFIEVNPKEVNFGEVEVGRTSKLIKIVVKNVHKKDVVFGTVNISGKDYLDFEKGTDTCSYNILKPGQSCEVEVFFRPRFFPRKKEKDKIKKIHKEGFLVIPFSEIPDIEKVIRERVPLKGTALIRE